MCDTPPLCAWHNHMLLRHQLSGTECASSELRITHWAAALCCSCSVRPTALSTAGMILSQPPSNTTINQPHCCCTCIRSRFWSFQPHQPYPHLVCISAVQIQFALPAAMQRFTCTVSMCRQLAHPLTVRSCSFLPAAALPATQSARTLFTASRRSASSTQSGLTANPPRRSFATEADKPVENGTRTATQPASSSHLTSRISRFLQQRMGMGAHGSLLTLCACVCCSSDVAPFKLPRGFLVNTATIPGYEVSSHTAQHFTSHSLPAVC